MRGLRTFRGKECLSRANPSGCEGSQIWEIPAIPDAIRSEPIPLEALDHLSNLVPSITLFLGFRGGRGDRCLAKYRASPPEGVPY